MPPHDGTDSGAWFPAWCFLQILAAQAESAGREVMAVDPRDTLAACPGCGHAAKENRPVQEKFHCVPCGHQEHADTAEAPSVPQAGWPVAKQQIPGLQYLCPRGRLEDDGPATWGAGAVLAGALMTDSAGPAGEVECSCTSFFFPVWGSHVLCASCRPCQGSG
ncbi:zinc ribbon domain-containing protein [Streptomyces sp. NPDC008121]|uniref:zinc ribbon domain-containing protein n=1 Tax=Streptomyces sp. NPDC008121 TaxID=3364809 RepID=UPI0036E3E302